VINKWSSIQVIPQGLSRETPVFSRVFEYKWVLKSI